MDGQRTHRTESVGVRSSGVATRFARSESPRSALKEPSQRRLGAGEARKGGQQRAAAGPESPERQGSRQHAIAASRM